MSRGQPGRGSLPPSQRWGDCGATVGLSDKSSCPKTHIELEKARSELGPGARFLRAPHPSPVAPSCPDYYARTGTPGPERACLRLQAQGWRGSPTHQFYDVRLSAGRWAWDMGAQATAVSLNQRRPVRGWPEPAGRHGLWPATAEGPHPTNCRRPGATCPGALPRVAKPSEGWGLGFRAHNNKGPRGWAHSGSTHLFPRRIANRP